MYQIIDNRTGSIVGTAKTLRAAIRKCDKLDSAFGAVRYSYRFVA
jgi:hypothetical protein